MGVTRSFLYVRDFFKKESVPVASKGKGGNTVSAVWEVVAPIAEQLGLSIWDIRFQKEGVSWYLRIYIDKEGGVGITDCENFSRAVDAPLDEADPIEQSYYLEVSSPGVERQLTRDEHFQKYIGSPVIVRLIRPRDGEREFKGALSAYDGSMITVTREDGSGLCFEKREVSSVKLDDFYSDDE